MDFVDKMANSHIKEITDAGEDFEAWLKV